MVVLAAALARAALGAGETGSNVSATRHNLTSSGPGPIRVAGAKDVCKFCHTPHSSNPIGPLWNRTDPGTYYQTYTSTTLVAQVGQPSGSSRLCLSCHDGTIALTQTYNPRNAPTGSIYITPQDAGYLGTDLSDDHPISFVYDAGLAARAGELLNPSSLPKALALDHNGQLQCTTCHDPHSATYGKFLTMSNDESMMCRTCHLVSGWPASSHATSSATIAGASKDKWTNLAAGTVRQAACEACHRPHTAGGRQRLLRHEAEEDNCLNCHDGSVAAKNIAAELDRLSRHNVREFTGIHDPKEDPSIMRRHVECADCHNSHQARAGHTATPPFLQPPMTGATGATGAGDIVKPAIYEYQVCYKCHGGRGTVRAPLVDRVLINTNVAEEFSPANYSFHPIETQGKNSSVPSLLLPWRTTSLMYCTDCHSSSATGGPRGPHGSAYTPLLVRNYATADLTTESPAAYDLCYGCHNRSAIISETGPFKYHKKHVSEKRTPCSACHDPHGISSTQSTPATGTHLINFDRTIALPLGNNTAPIYTDSGNQRGSCTLRCHNKDHNNLKYP
jgi:predicted CXXCH cytochrome family protein